jgi:uncharacterized protein (DUF433 family)
MASVLRSLRVPAALEVELERELERRGATEWSSGVVGILDEALRTLRAPGVVFVDGRPGRRAAVAHSGLEAWEIVATWKEGGESWEGLRTAYPELSELQLRAALNYHRLYPAEIDARLAREAAWTPERVAREMPFTQPARTGPPAGPPPGSTAVPPTGSRPAPGQQTQREKQRGRSGRGPRRRG